ncbi:MAG: TetR/AcrR family transcriptional regulator [Oscillospiraceae bacterium]|nr:TetR/AcrR family transcriptional regulator [Oscillospiraceae bacterium]MDD4368401.1 TetR/AcrR family transcriptional regulator [Oscillospiraceae bacterium]
MDQVDTRGKIVAAASYLFQTKGYAGTGLNEILRESGAPKGSLYYYFPGGKEALALAAIEQASHTMQAKVRQNLALAAEPVAAIRQVLADMIQALQNDGQLLTLSLSMLALETCHSSEPLRQACARSFREMAAIYTAKLAAGGYPPARAAEGGQLLQATIEGAIILSLTQKDTAPLQLLQSQLPDLLKPRNWQADSASGPD